MGSLLLMVMDVVHIITIQKLHQTSVFFLLGFFMTKKKIAKSICDANVNMGVVKSVIYKQTGHTVTLQACHYLSSLNDDLIRMANLSELGSADTIIDFLKSKKYDYITLFNSVVTDLGQESLQASKSNNSSQRLS